MIHFPRQTPSFLGQLLLLASCLAMPVATAAEVPRPAILYDLDMTLATQTGKDAKLADFSGKPLVISMFYSSCGYACPLSINNIKSLVRALGDAAGAGDVRVLLVSFDPEVDTPEVLRGVVTKYKLDTKRWTLARAKMDEVENLAAVLGVKFKKVAPQSISHTSVVTIVAANGEIVKQTEQYSSDADSMISALKDTVLKSGKSH